MDSFRVFFVVGQPLWSTFLLNPQHKKASYSPEQKQLQQFLLSSLYSLGSIFLFWFIIVEFISYIIVLKEFISLFTRETGKRHSPFTRAVAKRRTCFANNTNLTYLNYHWKNWVDWKRNWARKNVATSKTYTLGKGDQKLKKYLHLNCCAAFYDTVCMYVCMYVCM